jgi:hypothetical protein
MKDRFKYIGSLPVGPAGGIGSHHMIKCSYILKAEGFHALGVLLDLSGICADLILREHDSDLHHGLQVG